MPLSGMRKISTTIHFLDKAWKSQDIFLYNSDCIRLKKVIYTMDAWEWVNHGVIIILVF